MTAKSLHGRVAIVTGAGRGLGRAHALMLASEGARVVVNDLGGDLQGHGQDATPAQSVVAEIEAAGGEAVVSGHDVSDWAGAKAMIELAVARFGDLHVLVNNAGILRDRALVNMSEAEWDAVIAVHLKGHFAPSRWAASYWREQAKAGVTTQRSLVHTSSTSGLLANPGQTNYGAAKSGIATFSQICAKELSRYHVVSNCIAPAARSRLTESTPGLGDIIGPPKDPAAFDVWDPANVSPLVAYLSSAQCTFNGATFFVQGGSIKLVKSWELTEGIERDGRWSVAELADALDRRSR
jgi:NAD(P)-dependent dehydrogenase (short-subunit alcohol dehydrogenase family)